MQQNTAGTEEKNEQSVITEYFKIDGEEVKTRVTTLLDQVSTNNKLYDMMKDNIINDIEANSKPVMAMNDVELSEKPEKRRYVIAPTGAGKTRVAMIAPIVSFLHNICQEKGMEERRHLVVIAVPYKVIAFQYFSKLSQLCKNGARPIVGKMLTGDNTLGNSLTLFFKKKAVTNMLAISDRDYMNMFNKKYWEIDKGNTDKGKVRINERLKTKMNIDFVVGSYEMIMLFLTNRKADLIKDGVIIHGVVDEFQEAFKSKEKRFTTAMWTFDLLASISNSFLVISGSYSLLNNDDIKAVLEESNFMKNIIPDKPKIVNRSFRLQSDLLVSAAMKVINNYTLHNTLGTGGFESELFDIIIPKYPELLHIADAIAHPGRGTTIVLLNNTYKTPEIIIAGLITLSYLQKREIRETEGKEVKGKPYYWTVPIYTDDLLNMDIDKIDHRWLTNEKGERLSDWEEEFKCKTNLTYQQKIDSIYANIDAIRGGRTKEQLSENEAELIDQKYNEAKELRNKKDSFQPRYICGSVPAFNHIRFGIRSEVSVDSEKRIGQTKISTGTNLLLYFMPYKWIWEYKGGYPHTTEEWLTLEDRENILEEKNALLYELNNYQDVSNFMLRCTLIKNNARVSYMKSVEDDIARRQTWPRMWAATTKIGVGADMSNIRRLICIQNPNHIFSEEAENQVMGRCDRERQGKTIFTEALIVKNPDYVEASSEEKYIPCKTDESYIALDNAGYIYKVLIQKGLDLYNQDDAKKVEKYPILNHFFTVRDQLMQKDVHAVVDYSISDDFGAKMGYNTLGHVDMIKVTTVKSRTGVKKETYEIAESDIYHTMALIEDGEYLVPKNDENGNIIRDEKGEVEMLLTKKYRRVKKYNDTINSEIHEDQENFINALGSRNDFYAAKFYASTYKASIYEEMKGQMMIMNDWEGMFNEFSIVQYLPYYHLGRNLLMANLETTKFFKFENETKKPIAISQLGKLMVDVDPYLSFLILPGEHITIPQGAKNAMVEVLKQENGKVYSKQENEQLDKMRFVWVPCITMVKMDKMFSFVDNVVKSLNLDCIVALYASIVGIIDNSSFTFDSETTAGREAISFANWQRQDIFRRRKKELNEMKELIERYVDNELNILTKIPEPRFMKYFYRLMSKNSISDVDNAYEKYENENNEKMKEELRNGIIDKLNKYVWKIRLDYTNKKNVESSRFNEGKFIADSHDKSYIRKGEKRTTYWEKTFNMYDDAAGDAQGNIDMKYSWRGIFELAFFLLYPSPVVVVDQKNDKVLTIGPSVNSASEIIGNVMKIVSAMKNMTLRDISNIIGNKQLSGGDKNSLIEQLLDRAEVHAQMFERLCINKDTKKYTKEEMIEKGMIQIYVVSQVAQAVARKFRSKKIGRSVIPFDDKLKIMEDFFSDTRIKTNAGTKIKEAEFATRLIFEQGEEVEEKEEWFGTMKDYWRRRDESKEKQRKNGMKQPEMKDSTAKQKFLSDSSGDERINDEKIEKKSNWKEKAQENMKQQKTTGFSTTMMIKPAKKTVLMKQSNNTTMFVQGTPENGEVFNDVPGDGKCGYWALCFAMFYQQNPQDAIEVRRSDIKEMWIRITGYIIEVLNKEKNDTIDEWEAAVLEEIRSLANDVYEGNIQKMLREINEGHCQLQHELISIVAYLYGYNIEVARNTFTGGFNNYIIPGVTRKVKITYSGTGRGGHYKAVMDKKVRFVQIED